MASRHDGLDMAHIKLVIEKLSKFHAASAVLEENNGPYSAALNQGMYDEKLKPMMESYFNNNMTVIKETIQTFKNGERYLKQMVNCILFVQLKRIKIFNYCYRKIMSKNCLKNA